MMKEVCQLQQKIEQTRKKMIILASHTSINHQDVIALSKQLDELIVKYIYLTRKRLP
ncbi:aspartyl-phosphate phosphatase Spo0E family protein [Bacillus massiliigorillae]|uniref:aspartyl-phosphate phosphatase Spo0E family protein n=1 Tax=Bacillus massiliigorillae TaxID=1243664 RepID=UPI0009DD9AA1|nr:aspartyl-phosphate phosphatase Spo0E family protein [Bacillus massiliigorillae]